MIKVEVSPTKYYEIQLEGGWMARVPTISIARGDARFQEIVTSLVRLGAPPRRAEEEAIASCQDLFTGSWVTKLKMATGRAAEEYKRRFGSLEGFDPEVAQAVFIPGGDRFWTKREGNLLYADAFRRMRDG